MSTINSTKSILIVTQYFWPENFRINELAKEFKIRGYSVEVLTSIPNYPSGKVFDDFVSNPEKFRDYSGIKVHRVWQFARNNNKLSLALNYLSFIVSATVYSFFKLRNKNFDLIFGVQLSPIFSMVPAIFLKKIIKKPLYFWVLDIWPDSLLGAGVKPSLIFKFLMRLCVQIYSSADILFLSSRSFEKKLIDMQVSSPQKIYFPQWIESNFMSSYPPKITEDEEVFKLMSKWKEKIIFTFTGNIGEAQDFPSLIGALKKCSNIKDIVLLVIGDGRYKEELVKKIKDESLDDVVFCLGQYPSKYMSLFYYYSSYLVLPLRDVPIFSYTLPGKIQSYMSSGKPIIGIVDGESARVIDEAKCGFIVSPGNQEDIASTFDKCCLLDKKQQEKLGRNGRMYVNENFKLESLLDNVMKYF